MTTHPLLKRLVFISGLMLGTAAFGADAAYEEAVKAYVTGATTEMQAVRLEFDALSKDAAPEIKKRYEAPRDELEKCEKLLAELRAAKPADFDRVKASYEKQRNVLLEARAKAIGA